MRGTVRGRPVKELTLRWELLENIRAITDKMEDSTNPEMLATAKEINRELYHGAQESEYPFLVKR